MPRRLRTLTVVCLLTFAGCAADDIKAQRGPPPCPDGTPELGVKDILADLPPGTENIRSDPAAAAPMNDALRHDSGDALRSIRSRVVAKRGRVYGTGVFVVNLEELIDPRDLLVRAKATADNLDFEAKDVTIAGQDAVLIVGSDGVVATGVVGDCSSVTLTSQNEAELRAVAEKVRWAE